jgi:DNA replication protein DnaC
MNDHRNNAMMLHNTLDQLRGLKLTGMADALTEQMTQPATSSMGFEDRLTLLVDREILTRDDRRYTRLLQKARLKYPQAAIEDLDTRAGRGLDRNRMTSLALGDWITTGHTITITGPTGSGKTWLACALAQYACRRGYSVSYLRTSRLAEELRLLHGAGSFGKWLLALAKTDLIILDDWGLTTLEPGARADLMEIIDDRAATRATLITSQLPIEHWHAWIGDATIADAILDRVMQRHHRITLEGDSMRRQIIAATKIDQETPANP